MYAEKRQCGKKSAIGRVGGKIKLGLEAKSGFKIRLLGLHRRVNIGNFDG